MAENPYRASQTAPPASTRFLSVKIALAVLLMAIGALTGIGAARHFLALFGGPGPGREIAAFGFPTFGTASVGCVICALGIARSRTRLAMVGILFFVLGIGGWYLFLYAVIAGWFQ